MLRGGGQRDNGDDGHFGGHFGGCHQTHKEGELRERLDNGGTHTRKPQCYYFKRLSLLRSFVG